VTCLPAERSPIDQTGRTPHECSGFVASKASAAELVFALTDLSSPSIVSRDDVYGGAERLGVGLDEHIQLVIDALAPHAEALGLDGAPRS